MEIDDGSTWRWHDRYLHCAVLFADLHLSQLGRWEMKLMVLISGPLALVVLVYLFLTRIRAQLRHRAMLGEESHQGIYDFGDIM
jgi:hypothetical protein